MTDLTRETARDSLPASGADLIVVARPLESALFGVAVASANVRTVTDVAAVMARMPAHAMRFVSGTHIVPGGAARTLLVLRVPADATLAIHAIEQAGGVLCDTLVTYTRTVAPGGIVTWFEDDPDRDQIHVREAQSSDLDAIRALAVRAFDGFSGHWHADPRLARAESNELYGRWAADLVARSGTATPLLVAASGTGAIGGFLALAQDEAGAWHVPLTAVDVDHRGKGLLRRMLYAASVRITAAGPVRFHYETQLTNWAATHVVTSCGFAPTAARLTFHLWTDSP